MRFFNLDKFVQVESGSFIGEVGIVTLFVQVAVDGFKGSGGCDIWRDDLERFNQELKTLEATRSGEIILKAIHPDAFRLGLKVVNRRHDIVMHGQITSLGMEIYGDFHNALQFAFEVDQSYMGRFAQEFDEMVSNIK
jgi:hypothetical protein